MAAFSILWPILWSILWLVLLALAVVASVCGLGGCSGPDAAAGPSAEETAVTGIWAGSYPVQGDTLLFGFDIAQNKTYAMKYGDAGGLEEWESGTWTIRGNHWITSPSSCNQADAPGGTMRPITCSGPDSLALNISGDVWDAHFLSGGRLVALHLVKI